METSLPSWPWKSSLSCLLNHESANRYRQLPTEHSDVATRLYATLVRTWTPGRKASLRRLGNDDRSAVNRVTFYRTERIIDLIEREDCDLGTQIDLGCNFQKVAGI